MLLGLVNGIGVAYLRIPSMIITLAINAVAQGLMVVYTGGFSPQDSRPPAMRYLATGFTVPGMPNAVVDLGADRRRDRLPADPHDASAAPSTPSATASAPPISPASTPARVRHDRLRHLRRPLRLRRRAARRLCLQGAQSMGDPYLLPAIAAVVLGGTSILGGRGTYLGTVAGVILITLLQSILSVMQMPEAGRQIIYGVVIIAMLLLYGRAPAEPVTAMGIGRRRGRSRTGRASSW